MKSKWMFGIIITLFIGAAAGFGSSFNTGIQPGYFEKQEAPAYGVSATKAMGAELGQEYEHHFKDLYQNEE